VKLTLEIGFWACLVAVAYNYVGYPVLLFVLATLAQAKSDLSFLLRRGSRRRRASAVGLPRVALLVAAYNEEATIEAKVKNALEVDYPADLLEVLIGLDSPTDSTAAILSRIQSARLRVHQFQARRGKLAVISDLTQQTSAEILVFTDANTIFRADCVRNLVRHFADPQVGAVSGEEIRLARRATETSGETLYWRYESALKVLESRLDCCLGANGAVYAVRRSLFCPKGNSIVEDFQVPVEIRFSGHRVVYDPEAIAFEELAPTFSSQFERRVRIAAGSLQLLFSNPQFLNPFRGLPALSFFSHRMLRWLGAYFLIVAFLTNAFLARQPFYASLFVLQLIFYLAALVGYWRKKRGKPVRFLTAPLYFCSMNLAYVFGLLRYIRGRQQLVWKVTPRQSAPEVISVKSAADL